MFVCGFPDHERAEGDSHYKPGDLLRETADLLTHEREHDYGGAYANCNQVARLWNAYVSYYNEGQENLFSSHDVALMMVLLKIGRIQTGAFKKDNYNDGAGWFDVAFRCNREELKQVVTEATKWIDDFPWGKKEGGDESRS